MNNIETKLIELKTDLIQFMEKQLEEINAMNFSIDDKNEILEKHYRECDNSGYDVFLQEFKIMQEEDIPQQINVCEDCGENPKMEDNELCEECERTYLQDKADMEGLESDWRMSRGCK